MRFELLLAFSFLLAATPAKSAEPLRLIFDTDMGNDVDDALALGVIHAIQSRRDCRLLAVTCTKDNELCVPYIDAVNTFYRRGEIPIGRALSRGVTPKPGKFLPLALRKDGDELRYPHDLKSARAPDSVTLLRKVLAKQPDGSVVICQVGFSTNLAALLDTKADDHSPLDGKQLARKKVKLLSVMAGAFRPIGDNPRHLEYNVKIDIPSARKIAAEWPTPIVYSGFEIGIAVRYPAVSIEQDFDYAAHHPLAESYRLYNPPPHNRPSWDLTSVLYAVYPERGFFQLSPRGRVVVEDDGFTRFEPQRAGPHRHLILTAEQRVRVTEALVQLASQPPN